MRGVISVRNEWLVSGAVMLAGFGWWVSSGGPTVAALTAGDVARMAGCGTVQPHSSPRAVKETLSCTTASGAALTVVAFEDNRRRDEWTKQIRAEMFVSGMFGTTEVLVTGDRWAVRVDDVATADRLVAATGGWRL